jgi:hypothetical protein
MKVVDLLSILFPIDPLLAFVNAQRDHLQITGSYQQDVRECTNMEISSCLTFENRVNR